MADEFLVAQGDDEWRYSAAIPREKGRPRADAVRKLLVRAAEGREFLARVPSHQTAGLVASVLEHKVDALGLNRDRTYVGDEDRHTQFAAQLAKKPNAPAHLIASWALQARGVSRTDANNWVNAADDGV